jgi:amino acid transporter
MQATEPTMKRKSLGYWSVVSIGIGGMVGGGIFAVLGLAVSLAKGGTPVAFALAGLVAMITSYSYARLSTAFPSQGGTVEFLNHGFGTGIVVGGTNILLWLSYNVMLALYAYAFGSYASSFVSPHLQPVMKHVFISGIIILLTLLNAMKASVVGRFEEWIVGFKVLILLLFIAAGFGSIDLQRLKPDTWSETPYLIAGGMIIFLAYEGFELIANTGGDVRNPQKTLPRSYYTAVGFVILLYVLVSTVTIGNLSVDKITAARDYALAESAKPFLGSFGFILIAIAALLSTSSAINATLYGASRVSYIIAKDGELPDILDRKIWNRPVEGLLITSGITLVVANFFDLSSISMMGSAGFLLIFAAVNASNFRLYKVTRSRRSLAFLGVIVCIIALGALIWQRATEAPQELWILVVMVGAAFLIETIYRGITGRIIRPVLRRKK